MKYIFLVCFLVLTAAWVGTRLSEPDLRSEVPVVPRKKKKHVIIDTAPTASGPGPLPAGA